ncbi:MAG: RNA polymerase sigma factor FliA [Burkholderiaceae bacterium]
MYTAQGALDQASMIERYAPMVRRVAAQLASRLPANVDIGDLIQAGMMGLMDAFTRYDENGGAQFETFATQRVRGAMLDELRGSDWMPRSVRRAQRTIEKAVGELEQRLMRAPTDVEIAAQMKLTIEQYQKLLGEARGMQLFYLEDLNGDEEGDGFLARYSGEATPALMDVLRDSQFRDALEEAIGLLPEREQYILSMYYEQDMNLKEIGAVLGVTESRVSQLHSQAVSRLRTRLKTWT